MPRIATPAHWKAVLCGESEVPVRVVPVPSSPAESGPAGARASAETAGACCWGVRSIVPVPTVAVLLLADARGEGSPSGQRCVFVPLARAGGEGAKDSGGSSKVSSDALPAALPQVETAPSKRGLVRC